MATKQIKINIPDNAKVIIQKLKENGYEAYVVGGCVRDSLLGIIPHDWDICTSATPDQMLQVFKDFRVLETGLKHGTITVLVDVEPYEVTTFRIDGEYKDNRHPEEVVFVNDVKKDLGRRDISINAMCYNDEVGLIDCFNGEEDLKNGIIRCVGNPDDRFNEDALRIMRVLRFASKFGFSIEENTAESLRRNKSLLQNIAVERINKEFVSLIMGKGAKDILLDYKEIIGEFIPEMIPCFNFEQKNPYHQYDVYEHIIQAVNYYKGDDVIVKLALFFHDIGKPACYIENETGGHFYEHAAVSEEMTRKILGRMRFDNRTKSDVSELVLFHDSLFTLSEKVVRRMLFKMGESQLYRLIEVRKADVLAHSEKNKEENMKNIEDFSLLLSKVIQEEHCFKIKDLAINGKDLIEMGVPQGPEIGKILNKILDAVINEEVENEKEKILRRVKEELSPA